MFKILIFLILLAGSSLFVTEVFSLEIELQKESDRIIESKGWLELEQHSLKEHLQIIIDQREFKNRISVILMSKNTADIQLPDNIESISSNPKISSMKITNEFACAPTKIDKACVIIEVEREGLGDNLGEMKRLHVKLPTKFGIPRKASMLVLLFLLLNFIRQLFNQKVVLVWMKQKD